VTTARPARPVLADPADDPALIEGEVAPDVGELVFALVLDLDAAGSALKLGTTCSSRLYPAIRFGLFRQRLLRNVPSCWGLGA
jgi:hypothetical protein